MVRAAAAVLDDGSGRACPGVPSKASDSHADASDLAGQASGGPDAVSRPGVVPAPLRTGRDQLIGFFYGAEPTTFLPDEHRAALDRQHAIDLAREHLAAVGGRVGGGGLSPTQPAADVAPNKNHTDCHSGASLPLMYELKSWSACQSTTYGATLASSYDEVIEGGGKHPLGKLPARLDRFAKAHKRAHEMSSWLSEMAPGAWGAERHEMVKRANALRQCGLQLLFRHYPSVDECKLHAARFCQLGRLCPLCASRRGAKLLRAHTERVRAVMLERPELNLCLITRTVKNGPDLGERFGHLVGSMKAQVNRRRIAVNGKGGRTEWTKVLGAVGSIEVKRGSGSSSWHPHEHTACLVEELPDQDAMQREWHELTKDSWQVDVRKFNYWAEGKPATPETIATGFSEVFKYALKFSDLAFSDNWSAYETLRRRRLISSFGLLFGVKVPDDLLDAPLAVEDLPYLELIFRWKDGHYGRVGEWKPRTIILDRNIL